jgi:hypothetical protein
LASGQLDQSGRGEADEAHALAARANGGQQASRRSRDQHDEVAGQWFFQGLEQAVGCAGIETIGLVDDQYAGGCLVRPGRGQRHDVLGLLDQELGGLRHQHAHVRMLASQDAPAHIAGAAALLGFLRAAQGQGQSQGRASLAHAVRPVEQDGVGQTSRRNRAQEQRGRPILARDVA